MTQSYRAFKLAASCKNTFSSIVSAQCFFLGVIMLNVLRTAIKGRYTFMKDRKIYNRLAKKNMLTMIPVLLIDLCFIIYHLFNFLVFKNRLYHLWEARILDAAVLLFIIIYVLFFLLSDKETRYTTIVPRILITGFICMQLFYGVFYTFLLFPRGDYFSSFYSSLVWTLLVFTISPVFSGALSIMSFFWISHFIDQYFFHYSKVSLAVFLVTTWIVSSIHFYFMYFYIKKDFESQKQKEMLSRISRTDALTNLQNRYALKLAMNSYIGKEITVIIGDIDNFKVYNDTYGHDIGDLVVKEYGRILVGIFGEERCYRFGGDELLIVTEQSEEEITASKEHYFKCVKQFRVPGVDDIPTGSLGAVRGIVSSEDDFRAMLKQADMNLYHVKNTNKGSYFASYYNVE